MRWLIWPLRIVLAFALAWACAALWIDGPDSRALAAALAIALAVLGVVLLSRRLWGSLATAALVAVVLGWWLSLPPSNDRVWAADVARLPVVRIDGEIVIIENIRDFDWTGAETGVERWRTETFDLRELEDLDLFVSSWGAPMIVHTILSWGFSDGRRLAVSIETRKEEGEAYSAVLGFFRQFELIGVAATERDIVGVRAAHRGERVQRWPLEVPPERARRLLEAYLAMMQDLERRPAWYNALTGNCTTAIFNLVRLAGGTLPLDWRIVVNGRLDEFLVERGLVAGGRPIEELREAADVTATAKAALAAPDFSRALRSR